MTYRYAWAVGISLAALVALVALLFLTLVAGPLVAFLVAATVGVNVELMRREYRAHRARTRAR